MISCSWQPPYLSSWQIRSSPLSISPSHHYFGRTCIRNSPLILIVSLAQSGLHSSELANSKSNACSSLVVATVASIRAKFIPRHTLGPAWNTGYVNWLGWTKAPSFRNRSGLQSTPTVQHTQIVSIVRMPPEIFWIRPQIWICDKRNS